MTKTCTKCGQSFPVKIRIDDKVRNLANRTVCLDCLPFKSKRSEVNDINGLKVCPKCKAELPFSSFFKDKTKGSSSYCRACVNEYTIEQNRRFKQQCVDYKGGICERCGYNKCLSALEFHHLDPGAKDFSISNTPRKALTEKVKQELDKCELVCSNCHREIHYELSVIRVAGVEPAQSLLSGGKGL